MISPQKRVAFQNKILTWYSENKRDLPWRQTREPYFIFISEVMSQQTQLSRVIPKYEAWIKKFPTIESLAYSKVSDALHYWSGLGYNRRALNMKKASEKIVADYNGKFPQTETELLSLPGIGQYTARAILCFAYDQQIAVVDTNIRKVMLTQFNISEKEISKLAELLLPQGKAYEWNQALMDYATAVLKKEKIPIPKQSKFHGSHRYYRGQVLKVLLREKKVPIKKLGPLIKKEYTGNDEEWLRKLVSELKTEGFIHIEGDIIYFVS